jgi:hypothetical protein
MFQDQPQRPESRVVLASILVFAAALVLAPRAAFAQECVTEFKNEVTGTIADGGTVCQVAVGNKCTFSMALCLNQEGCSQNVGSKKVRASGHCGPVGKVFVKGSGTSPVCGNFAGITVRTRNHGRNPGKCTIRAKGGTDLDKVNLLCQPPGGSCPGVPTTTTTVPVVTTTTAHVTTTSVAATTSTTAHVTTTTQAGATTTTTTVILPTTTTITLPTTTTIIGLSTTTTTAAASTTTTTSVVGTTTTTSPSFTKLKVTTNAGSTSCGGAGLIPAPVGPFSGELDSDTAGTTKIIDLGLGCLYIGGGFATAVPPDKIPDGADSVFTVSGSNLTPNAGTGSADCTNGAGPSKHCFNDGTNAQCTAAATPYPCCTGAGTGTCPRSCASDVDCAGTGSSGACQLDANCFFGPPLSIPNPQIKNLSTCVLNVIESNASGTADAATGASSVSLPLFSVVNVTGNVNFPCPKCVSGTCNSGPNVGKACTGVGSLGTTAQCPPDPTKQIGSLAVTINPLTTGTASMTSATSSFCPSQANAGAFGVANANCTAAATPFACCTGAGTGTCDPQRIAETGSPGGDLTDGLAHNAKEGAVFCIPSTGNAGVDAAADLPGPGSIGLNTSAQLLP